MIDEIKELALSVSIKLRDFGFKYEFLILKPLYYTILRTFPSKLTF